MNDWEAMDVFVWKGRNGINKRIQERVNMIPIIGFVEIVGILM